MRAIAQYTITSINDVIAADTPPDNPYLGMLWTNTAVDPPETMIWDGNGWRVQNEARISQQISSLIQQADRLESTVSQISSDYVTTEELSSSIRQQADSLLLQFNQIRQDLEGLDEETQKQLAQFTAFFHFKADGLYMGEEGSSLVLHQKGGEDGVIEFLRGGTAVLTIAPGGIIVDTIQARKSIKIGNFMFSVDETGNLLTIS